MIIATASMLVMLTSCFDSAYDINNISNEIELTPGVALPLAHGSLSIDDLLSQLDSTNIINTDPDSLLYIYYSADLFSYKATEVIKIDTNQNFPKFSIKPTIPAPFVIPGAIGDTVREITVPIIGTKIPLAFDQNLEFAFENGERIDSVVMNNINMHINVKSTFQNDIFLDFHAENLRIDGKPWRKIVPITGAEVNIDEIIRNLKVQLSFNSGTTLLALQIDLFLINRGETIRPGDNCEITMSFLDNKFTAVYGYLGEYDVLTDDGQIDVSFFNNKILGGSISFASPDMVLHVNNSFGMPLQVDLGIDVVSTTNIPPITPITFIGTNPFVINTPVLSNPNQKVPTTIRVNKDNSNFIDAMATSPDHLNYTATARMNNGGPSANYNFITDSSALDVSVEVTLPIDLKARGFIFEDTISLDFESQFGNNIDMVDSLGLTLEISNGIPLEVDIQVYFTDSSYTVLDSMFNDSGNFIEAGILKPDGKQTTPAVKTNRNKYTAAALEKIKGGKFARIKATLNTPIPPSGSQYFKFFSYYEIGFNISANAYLRINSKNL
jgi:hypothetical protein